MKNILILAAIFAATFASAQTKSVLKNINGGTITESLTIGSGKTLTIASGATINATGATITGFTASAAWGGITGTLADQTDISTALGLKAPIDSPAFTGTATFAGVGLGTAAFADYGTDEFQLLRWASNSNSFPPFSIITATELGALKRTTQIPVNLGGTGAVTAAAALNNLLPDQTGHEGQYLYVSGGNAAWGDAFVNADNIQGSIPVSKLNGGTDASETTFWRGDGTWATVTGGVTSVSGTANEITVTGTTTPTLSLPAALTFTGKTLTGGTFSSPTLTTPRIASGGFIADANGNELIVCTTTASAVNELTLANAATGTNPTITASGADTNIGETHAMKGTGSFTVKAGTTSGNSQQWLNSSGSAVAYVRNDGWIVTTFGIGIPNIYTQGGALCAATGTFGGANALAMVGASFAGPVGFVSSQSLTGAGAVNVTSSVTKVTTTGAADALTLADGADGQIKIIIHAVDGGGFVLTPTTKTGFSSITSLNAGDTISLIFSTTIGWTITSVYGATVTP